jgi:diacylglycerol kinase (ATP)
VATTSELAVVVNPSAGRGKAGKLVARLAASLRELRVPHEIRVTDSPTDTEAVCRALAGAGADIVAVIGGDGTASCAANGLLGTETALAIVPGGTGDDTAKAFGVHRYRDAIDALANPAIHRIDVGRITLEGDDDTPVVVRHFLNVAGAGFDAEVNETANGMHHTFGGTGTYIVALVKTLRRFTPVGFRIETPDGPEGLDAMLIAVGNGRSYGGGMKVTPDADMTDGTFDVCVIGCLSKGAFIRAFPSVFRGGHTDHPAVRMLRVPWIRLSANRPVLLYADGERVGPVPALLEVLPNSLRVVTGHSPRGMAR